LSSSVVTGAARKPATGEDSFLAPYRSPYLTEPATLSIATPLRPSSESTANSDDVEVPIPVGWMTAGLVLSFIGVTLLMWSAGLTLDPRAPANGALLFAAALASLIRYIYRAPKSRAQRIARDAAEYLGMFTVVVVLGALASYPMAVGTTGYVDATLQQIDRFFRFNWVGWYDFTAAHKSLQLLGSLAYASIYLTPVILLSYFAQADRKAEARVFIASFWGAAILTLMLFMAFPAQGPLAFLIHGSIPYMPTSALYQSELIPLLRDGTFHQVSLGVLRGLVCAPSFHTTSAVLFMLAAWPIRSLRWPLIALNCAMLLSIPVEGTHYLADMIGGALVALVANALFKFLTRRLLLRKTLDSA
jgi:hypothetical protein